VVDELDPGRAVALRGWKGRGDDVNRLERSNIAEVDAVEELYLTVVEAHEEPSAVPGDKNVREILLNVPRHGLEGLPPPAPPTPLLTDDDRFDFVPRLDSRRAEPGWFLSEQGSDAFASVRYVVACNVDAVSLGNLDRPFRGSEDDWLALVEIEQIAMVIGNRSRIRASEWGYGVGVRMPRGRSDDQVDASRHGAHPAPPSATSAALED
jgi:hypothetical protein